ncbi:MAG TPA: hypothetical protein VFJ85_03765 [Acidimicrobiales bacterium]|nr:hypothetical protein [Acidimicrobiales bacterium]
MMEMMAAGDMAAVFLLVAEFGDQIAMVLRRHLRDLGVADPRPDDLQGLVVDAGLALQERAGAWRADGGALPWTWADRRLRALASAHVGVRAGELPPDVAGPEAGPAPPVEADEVEVLHALARERPDCRLLLQALDSVASPRNQSILLSVKVQAALGDPSPSVTVARQHGLRPDAVRQVVKRALDKLRGLAAGDDRFAPLADLALLA